VAKVQAMLMARMASRSPLLALFLRQENKAMSWWRLSNFMHVAVFPSRLGDPDEGYRLTVFLAELGVPSRST
jgi:hypothetical protein